MTHQYSVYITYDSKANMWFISSSQVPGLCAEHQDLDMLIANTKELVPELLRENIYRGHQLPEEVVIEVIAHTVDQLARHVKHQLKMYLS